MGIAALNPSYEIALRTKQRVERTHVKIGCLDNRFAYRIMQKGAVVSFFGISFMPLGFNAAGFNTSLYSSSQNLSQPRSARFCDSGGIRLSPPRQG